MRKAYFGLAAGLVLAVVGTAAAQHRPTPIPSGDDPAAASSSGHHGRLPPLRFPTTAAHYNQVVERMLEIARRLVGKGGVTSGDVNKLILEMKECQANVTSDGVVTAREAEMCNTIYRTNMPKPHPAH